MKNMIKTKSLILLNLFWFALIAFLSYRMPMIADDYDHIYSFATGDRITTISMIPGSVATYYMTWGGRALSMIFIQLMLMLPRWVYAIMNGLMYVLMVNVISGYSSGRPDEKTQESIANTVTISLIYLFIWFFMPDFAEVTIWLTGSITYLWTTTLILVMGGIYYRDYLIVDDCEHQSGTVLIVRVVGMVILGFCAGLSNESGACTLICALVIYTVMMKRTGRKITIDRIAGIISCIAGTAVLIFAPGNRVRSASVVSETEHGRMINVLFFRFARENFYFLLYLLIPLVICVVLFLWQRSHDDPDFVKNSSTIPAFWGLALISVYVLTFSSGFADRVLQFPLLLIAASFGILIRGIVGAHISTGGADIQAKPRYRTIVFLIAGLILAVLVEIIAGSLYARQSDSYFDRHMYYLHLDADSTSGLLPGNGMLE